MAHHSEDRAGLERDPEIDFTTTPLRPKRPRQAKRTRSPREEDDRGDAPQSKPPLVLVAVFLVPLVLLGLWAALGG